MSKRFKLMFAVIAGTVAVSLPVVLTAGAAQTFTPDNLPLTVVSENNKTITFSYPTIDGYGYVYKTKATEDSDFVLVSRTNDANDGTVRFSKGPVEFSVGALGEVAVGTYKPAPPADTTAPNSPTGLSASSKTETSFAFAWAASTDNVGVTGYDVFRNGTNLGTTTNLNFNFTGLACGTTYNAGVRAHDAAGNNSSTSTLSVTTVDCAQTQTITIGETTVLSGSDSGNGNLLLAQNATLSQSATLQSLSFYVTTAAGNLRLGVFNSSGPSGGPGAKLAETNSFAAVSGWNTQNVVTPVVLQAGTYWLAYLPSSNSLGFRDGSGGTAKYYSYAYAPMPTTFSTNVTTLGVHWSFYATLTTGGGPPPPNDTQAPTVTLTSPNNGATVSGSVNVAANATDNVGVTKVEFYQGANLFATDTTSPYSASFDSTALPNGSASFSAKGYDAATNVGNSASVSVTVDNSVQPPPGDCATSTPNVPDGPDNAGGCFPGPSNTGPNAPASSMATYSGPCTITVANTTIDSKVVNCQVIDVRANGFTLKNSYLNGGIVNDGSSFTVQDTLIDSGRQFPACSDGSCPAGKYACGDTQNQTFDCGVTGNNFTVLRTEIINTNRSLFCESPGPCMVQDNYFHGTNLWPDRSNMAHASGMREEQNGTFRHNSVGCTYPGPFVNSEIGCSADLTGYPDFAPIKNNTVDGNLFLANTGNAFCAYGGATAGKPFSGASDNATNQKFTNNVFQRGTNGKCGDFGAITDFAPTRSGNVWNNNKWDDGTVVNPG